MSLPSYAYGDPATIIERADSDDVRHTHGCAACRHRGGQLLGRTLCARGLNPGKRGFCRRWILDEDWHHPSEDPPHGSTTRSV